MTRAHWRYILLEQGAVASAINVVLNGAIAWFAHRGAGSVPLWGSSGIAGDVVCTTFLLPLITSLIVTRLARADVRRGRLAPLDAPPGSLFARLPHSVRFRSLLFGVLATLVVAPMTLGAVLACGISQLDVTTYVTVKSLFAGALAALLTPLIALAALHDVPAAAR